MVRAIQVGLGNWGFSWAQEVIPTVPDIEMVGYADPSDAARARLQTELGIPPELCFDSLEAAARAGGAELVIATLRTEAHFPMVDKALELGLNVIVEKPFASTLSEAKALVAKAEAKGLMLMVSQNYRHHAAPLMAADLVARRTLGEPTLVSLTFRKHAPSIGYRFWDMPDPLLADMAIHHFDLMRMVLGTEPVRIACRSWNLTDSRFVHHPIAVASIEFAGGVVVNYTGSWLSGAPDTPWAGEWSIDCTGGEIAFASRRDAPGGGYVPDRIEIRPIEGRADTPRLVPPTHLDRAGALAAAARTVAGEGEGLHFSSGRDNLMSLALVRGAIASAARSGAWIEIEEVMAEDGNL